MWLNNSLFWMFVGVAFVTGLLIEHYFALLGFMPA